MPIVAKRRQQVIFRISAGARIGLMHPLRQLGAKESVILSINPQHGNPRGTSEVGRRLNQLVGGTLVVWLAANAPAASRLKGDDRLDRRQISARERNCRPAAGR